MAPEYSIEKPVETNLKRIARLARKETTPSIIITTHDDPTNIYLTIYGRKLAPEVQIICRANLESNIARRHTAGADLVMS